MPRTVPGTQKGPNDLLPMEVETTLHKISKSRFSYDAWSYKLIKTINTNDRDIPDVLLRGRTYPLVNATKATVMWGSQDPLHTLRLPFCHKYGLLVQGPGQLVPRLAGWGWESGKKQKWAKEDPCQGVQPRGGDSSWHITHRKYRLIAPDGWKREDGRLDEKRSNQSAVQHRRAKLLHPHTWWGAGDAGSWVGPQRLSWPCHPAL